MFENKNIKRLLFGFLTIISVYISLSSDNVIWCSAYDVLTFIPHAFLCVLLWVLYTDKLIRAAISCIGLFWIYDFFLAVLFRVNKELAEVLNTKYAYGLSIVFGLILFLFYLWVKKKK